MFKQKPQVQHIHMHKYPPAALHMAEERRRKERRKRKSPTSILTYSLGSEEKNYIAARKKKHEKRWRSTTFKDHLANLSIYGSIIITVKMCVQSSL